VAVAVASPAPAPRRITVLGATGSVGTQTLDLVGHVPDLFEVEALTARRSVAALAAAARRHRARLAVIGDADRYGELKDALAGTGIEVAAGSHGLAEAAARPADLVMSSIVGAAGLAPTLIAIGRGAIVALATKECLVCAGSLFMDEVRRTGATLLPVDSEHNAIFQALRDEPVARVERLILTASGGPFRRRALADMAGVTPAEAVAHPNWDMGAKISIDSATMMNKGLELVEAHHLFGLDEAQLDILVHPESIVHSLVAFRDGSLLAQLGQPDMRIPIAYTLGWPGRLDMPTPRLDLAAVATLSFEAPDATRFPALRVAREALRRGGSAPTALNAANEVAVQAFLDQQIGFLDIVRVVEATLERTPYPNPESLDHILHIDDQARRGARELVAACAR